MTDIVIKTRKPTQQRSDNGLWSWIKPKAQAWLEDWNSDITGALDKLFLQGVAGVIQHYHWPPTLVTLAQHSPQGKSTKALHLFSQDSFFALSNEESPVTVILLGHRSWLELSSGAHVTLDGSRPVTEGHLWLSCSARPALPAHTNVLQQLSCSWKRHGDLPSCTLPAAGYCVFSNRNCMQCCVRLNIGGKLPWYWREKSFVIYFRCRNCYCPKHFPSLPSEDNQLFRRSPTALDTTRGRQKSKLFWPQIMYPIFSFIMSTKNTQNIR